MIAELALLSVAFMGPGSYPTDCRLGCRTPQDVVTTVAGFDSGTAELVATVVMQVQATGFEGRRIFLNSERDYRDQRNLSIVIEPDLTEELSSRHGDLLKYFRDRLILVTGRTRRVRIYFLSDGGQTDKYYYQTHMYVSAADQIVPLVSDPLYTSSTNRP